MLDETANIRTTGAGSLGVVWLIVLIGLALLGCQQHDGAQQAAPTSQALPPSPAVLAASKAVGRATQAALLPDVIARAEAAVRYHATAAQSPTALSLLAVSEAAYARCDVDVGLASYALTRAMAPLTADEAVMHGEGLLRCSAAEHARDILIAAERAAPQDPRFAPLIGRSFDEDPRFIPAVRVLHADADLDAIKYLGGGSTIVVRFIKDKEVFAAFKPKQSRLQSDFRSEIAAWRFCSMIRCGFDIPYNAHVKLPWKTFDGLFSRLNSAKQIAYRDNFSDLRFVKEDDVEWVHGTMKDWVPDFTWFPIEITEVWRDWLLLERTEIDWSVPASETITAIRKRHPDGERIAGELTRHMGEMSKRELARQVSNVLVFDYLTNNWDRFSGVPEFWGVNCQFKDGHILSIDNGASFPKTANEKVDKQLHRVQRFSRQVIAAVRSLEHDRTLARLFPDANDYERERFETFWTQREQLLAYVDGLIAEHGADAVLFFE